MKTFLFITFLSIGQHLSFGQIAVPGMYELFDGSSRELNIKPDGQFEYKSTPSCALSGTYATTGEWSLLNDTLLCLNFNDSTKSFYFICPDGDIVDTSNLVQFTSISDSTVIFAGYVFPYIKTDGYYENGAIEWTSEYEYPQKNGNCIYFYENGNVKSKGLMKNDKRSGKWIYFSLEGKVIKKEIYYKGKIYLTKNYN